MDDELLEENYLSRYQYSREPEEFPEIILTGIDPFDEDIALQLGGEIIARHTCPAGTTFDISIRAKYIRCLVPYNHDDQIGSLVLYQTPSGQLFVHGRGGPYVEATLELYNGELYEELYDEE